MYKIVRNRAFVFSTAIMATLASTPVLAQEKGISEATNYWATQIRGVVDFVFIFAAFIGLVLVGLGLAKLKAAADTQGQQVKYGDGLWRLGIGAALMALPFVAGTGIGTLTDSGTDPASIKESYFK